MTLQFDQDHIDFDLSSENLAAERNSSPEREIELLSLRELYDLVPDAATALLEGCYDAYAQAFPDENERESLEDLKESLCKPEANWDLLAVLRDGAVIGARHITELKVAGVDVAFGEYIWVIPEERRKGLGSAIVKQSEKELAERGVAAIFSEQNDPFVMTQEQKELDALSGITTEGRAQFWNEQGYSCLDAPYIQPALSEDSEEVSHLRICLNTLGEGLDGKLSSEFYIELIEAYFKSWQLDEEPVAIVESLRAKLASVQELKVIPLSEERSNT